MGSDYRKTWLWRQAFEEPRDDADKEEQDYFRKQYLAMRENVGHLVNQIPKVMPSLTVHDLSHLDFLWGTASLVTEEEKIHLSPPAAFVFGASVLLHDAALTIAAYPNGIEDIKKTVEWQDADARLDQSNCSRDGNDTILPDVLRRLHARQAEVLAKQAWTDSNGQKQYLIENSALRSFYGETIGKIAYSHWWDIQRIEQELSQNLGPFSETSNCVDKLMVACLLRIADALHVDLSRAPKFLRTLTQPEGLSALHWSFQEKLARPYVESDAVVFTSSQPFHRNDVEAWWLAYDTLTAIDRELRDVDLLLRSCNRTPLAVRRLKGVESPEALSKIVGTQGWRPVNARLQVSDVPQIIETLGGQKLYGNDPLIPLRELIQNAADAIKARRLLEKRETHWGEVEVSIRRNEEQDWLVVKDNGIGMSENILTGPAS